MSQPSTIVERKQLRFRLRLFQHHLPLLVVSVIVIAALYFTRPYKDVVSRASFATAYPALALLCGTLLIGPWAIVRKQKNPVSSDLRRDMGIWAGILGILHSAIGQCVHLRGRPWLYYVYAAKEHHSFPLRHDLFGAANYTGAVGALLLIMLLATSNDYFLRVLGTAQWKKLQRWNYAVFVLAAVHSFAFQGVEKQHLRFVATVAICTAITVALQITGFAMRRAQTNLAPIRR